MNTLNPCLTMQCDGDCNPNYLSNTGACKQIFTPSSSWSSWSVYDIELWRGGDFIQSRSRNKTTTDQCNQEPTQETRSVNPSKTSTLITTFNGDYCVEPETSNCNTSAVTRLVLRSNNGTYCNETHSMFNFNPINFTLVHECSNRPVCFGPEFQKLGQPLVASNNCPTPTLTGHLGRTSFNTIQFGRSLCINKFGSSLVAADICTASEHQFILPLAVRGRVKVSHYTGSFPIKDFNASWTVPGTPFKIGYTDHVDVSKNLFSMEFYARIQTYFVTPLSGDHQFQLNCDDKCKLFVSTSDRESDKIEIMDRDSWNPYNVWDRPPSGVYSLTSGKPYYLEALLQNVRRGAFISVGVIFPDGSTALPLTFNYLKRFE